ncbi:MAG: DUF58 domain-containing protein [Candidatus Pacearchaeota archaeon]
MEKRLVIDYEKSYSLFEKAIKKFQLKKVIYRILFKGKGLEFEGYRDYREDDDFYSIDWKATLRAGKKMIKQYKEERDVVVYFLVDASKRMLFGSGKKLKAEFCGEVICVLANLVVNSGDKASLILFADKLIKFIPPSSSKEQIFIFKEALSNLNNYGGEFDLENCIKFSFLNAAKFSSNSFVLASDFLHFKKSYEKDLPLLFSKGDFFSLMIRDKMDEDLPSIDESLLFKNPFSEKKILVNPSIIREKFRVNALKQKEFVKSIFKRSGVDLLELKNGDDFVLSLANFIKKRAEEMRI